MRMTSLFIATLREVPAEAEIISHQLMLRGGFIRKVAAGIYSFMPLGWKVIKKVENIIREELTKAGAQEVLLPALQPAELWGESGRWDIYGKELMRLKDRHDREFCLGPTHEEVITDLVRQVVKSYRQLPINLFQIQTKFRDEIRPRFGLMRGREFIMKDAYSFHTSEEDLDREYKNMAEAYKRIFERCGLEFKVVDADPGAIGGSSSQEFMVLAPTGEDEISHCTKCDYAASHEMTRIGQRIDRNIEVSSSSQGQDLEKVHTPDIKTVGQLTEFFKVKPDKFIKTLIHQGEKKNYVVLVRGDHSVNEVRLREVTGEENICLAEDDVVEKITGAPVGFAGPIGLKDVEIIADFDVAKIVDGITGANEADQHYKNVNLGRDFKVDKFCDIRLAVNKDLCPRCREGKIKFTRGIEVGHIFKLGTKYSKALKAEYLAADNSTQTIIMGCYGIGVGRTAQAAIEQSNDENGIVWPLAIAPFQVAIVPVNIQDEQQKEVAEKLYKDLNNQNIEVLLEDREERVGVKLKDIDLIGIPIKIIIGPKGLQDGKVELKMRKTGDMELVAIDQITEKVKQLIKAN